MTLNKKRHLPILCTAFLCLGTAVGIEMALRLATSTALPYVAVALVTLSSVLFAIPHFVLVSKPERLPQP